MTTFVYAVVIGLFALLLLWNGWLERKNDNARDARLLFAMGAGTGLMSAGTALLF